MTLLIDPKYQWKNINSGSFRAHYISHDQDMGSLLEQLAKSADIHALCQYLLPAKNPFALIIDTTDRLIAAVDKIRSYPVFYTSNTNEFAISNAARKLKDWENLNKLDAVSLLEFKMAGYVTGRETLYQNLFQLQAGECIVWDKKIKRLERSRYYRFFKENCRTENEAVLIEELGSITDVVFKEVIANAAGRPIWIPLSGGLDSRLVACKLKELKYDNIQTFSYGPPGNFEAKNARHVAEILDLPWTFVPSTRNAARAFFWSDIRRDYWSFSDNLCSVPFMQDIIPLRKLQRQKILPDDAVLINGNSGDFITGGHIPSALTQGDLTEDTFYQTIIEKHFSLWLHLNPTIDLDRIREKIKQVFIEHPGVLNQRAADFELWEWQERQAKYVINGQRTYDFLNLAWELPLWHDEYLHFWSAVPIALKYQQKLYTDYLDSYDFKGLFKTFKPALWRWPGNAWLVIPLAQMLGICGGQKMKTRFYHYMKYFGHYSDQYAPFGYFHFLRHIGRARSGVSFFSQAWISENQGISWDGIYERDRKHSIPRATS